MSTLFTGRLFTVRLARSKRAMYTMPAKFARNMWSSTGEVMRFLQLLQAHTTFLNYINDEDGRLGSVFWATGLQKQDALLFDHVIIMDTTFLTNRYGSTLLCPGFMHAF